MIIINTDFFELWIMAQAFQIQSLLCRSVQGSQAFEVMRARAQLTHPSVTDPSASIFSPGFRKRTSLGRQIFHQVASFCQVAVLPFSNIHK